MNVHAEVGEATSLGRRTPAREMPFGAVALRWVIALGGVALLAALNYLHPTPISHVVVYALFGTLIVIADGLLFVRAAPGSYFSFGYTFLFAYFLFFGGLAAASLDALTRLFVWALERFRRRPQTPLFAFFHVGQSILSVLGAAWAIELILNRPALFQPVHHAVSSLAVFAAVQLALRAILSSLAVWARSGYTEVRTQLWPRTVTWTALSIATSLPFALLIVYLRPTAGYWGLGLVFFVLAGLAMILNLNAELRTGNEELKAINRIGTLLNATLDTSQLLKILARETRRVLQWDGFFVALINDDSDQIDITFMTRTGSEIAHRRIPKRAGLTGKAISTGELVHYERNSETAQPDPEDTIRGSRRPRSIVVAPLKFGEQVIGAISVQSLQSDIYGRSHFRLLQTIAGQAAIAIRNAQLFESEQRARLERDEFLSLVTHEIKNPLTSISGYTDFAEEAVKKNDVESAVESLEIVRSEARRILRLAEDLLDASRLSAGRFTVKMEEVDLPAVVSQIANRYAVTTNRDIEVEIPREFPRVLGDSLRLGQVIENLISNAVKYSPDETPIRVSLDQADSKIRLSVSDQGPGIPKEKIPLIFERFYRVEENGQVVKGTGLGLFISKEIVRMHGGAIVVKSQEGQGSTFTVELPRQPELVPAETVN